MASAAYAIAVATPTFNPPAGSYGSTQPVTISTTTSGASIRYTTDGSTPSETVGTVYGGPVSVSSNLTLKAIAYESGMTDSQVASAAYTIAVATPTFNPPAGSYGSTQPVTISIETTSGASIRYTTDGSTPSETVGTVYGGPVSVSSNLTLKAIAYESGMTDSQVGQARLTPLPWRRRHSTPRRVVTVQRSRSPSARPLPELRFVTPPMVPRPPKPSGRCTADRFQ